MKREKSTANSDALKGSDPIKENSTVVRDCSRDLSTTLNICSFYSLWPTYIVVTPKLFIISVHLGHSLLSGEFSQELKINCGAN